MTRPDLPSGTVTFLFTDVEGSTRLLHELGAEIYAAALAEHRRVIREACARHDGVEVDTQGDAFFFAFPTAPGALAAASAFTEVLSSGAIRVRVGLHTGTPLLTEEGYVGGDVHRAARIAACGHGGQVLVSSSTAQLVELELADLGEHRLKDLSAPERVFQLGDREFPTLKSLYRTNLPVPATPFLGRERELAEVLALLAEDGVRLLTLTGPGGTGKTRLALHAAGGSADRYPDGVYWVPLAPLRDPALVLGEASQALAARDGLAAHIADKELLLLFDNFEHVVEAAPGLAELLSACPNLSLLVTSRELLALPGEQAYPVPPLAEEDGSELFLARARAADPGFRASTAVGELCAELEQLPLALELAAARVRVLTPEKLLERLSGRLDLLKAGRGVDPRQQTLRATIEWSYELLSEEERQLFARLACFRGGCTLDASEEICQANLDLLQSLVDKSLLRFNEGRFWMLETIREYAAERLEESGEWDELRRRHAEWFVALAGTAEPQVWSATAQKEWLERLDPEHDNVRAAFDWLEASGEGELLLRLGAAFITYWNVRGHYGEGARRLERALAADERPSVARARALLGSGVLSVTDHAKALRRIEEAGALSEQLGDVLGAARAKLNLGTLAIAGGDLERGRQLLEESVEAFRSLGDELFELQAARRVAWAYESLGDVERARALWEECLRRARATDDRVAEGQLLGALAGVAVDDGRLAEAAAMLLEAYGIRREIGDPYDIGVGLFSFARLRAAQGDWETAARLASAADARLEEIGASLRGYDPPWVDRSLTAIRTELGEEAFAREWREGATLSVEEAIALALAEHEPDA